MKWISECGNLRSYVIQSKDAVQNVSSIMYIVLTTATSVRMTFHLPPKGQNYYTKKQKSGHKKVYK